MASKNNSISSRSLRREIKRPAKPDGFEVAYIGVGRRIVSGSRKQKKGSDSDYQPDSASDDQHEMVIGSDLKAATKNVRKHSKPDKRHAGPANAGDNSRAPRLGHDLTTRSGGVGVGHGRELAASEIEDKGEGKELPRGPRITRPSKPIPYKPFNPFKAVEPAAFPTKDRITEAPAVAGAATSNATLPIHPLISDTVQESPNDNNNSHTSPQRSSDVVETLDETPKLPLTRPTPAQLRQINSTYNSIKQAQSDTKCLQYLGVTFTPDGKPIHDLSTAVSKHLNPTSNPDFDKSHKPFPNPAADKGEHRARHQHAFETLHPMVKNLIVTELLDDSASELVASAASGLPAVTMAVVEQLLGVEREAIEQAKEEAARLREEAAQERSVPRRADVVAALRWLAERGLPGSLVCLYSELYDIDVSGPVEGEEAGVVKGGDEMERQDSKVGAVGENGCREGSA